jgi:hypothetical protein
MLIVRSFFVLLSVLTVASFQAKAQSFPALDVHIPYTVMAGQQLLSPGDYRIQPVSGDPNLFALYKDGGMAFETFLRAVPEEKLDPAQKSEIVLRSDGPEYVLDQMWVEGMERGYQFVTPQSFKSRQHERRVTVVGEKKTA